MSWPASEPAIHLEILRSGSMDGRGKPGHDMGGFAWGGAKL